MNQFFQTILNFFTSEKVAYISTIIITIGAPTWAIIQKFASKKLKIKLDNKNVIIKDFEEKIKQYQTTFNNTLIELSTKYIEAEKTIDEITKILNSQNNALKIAFNNSNINASAKQLIEETLFKKSEESVKPVEDKKETKNEIIEEVVATPIIEEKPKGEIKRVK